MADLPFLHFEKRPNSKDPDLTLISRKSQVATNRPSFIVCDPRAYGLKGFATYSDVSVESRNPLGPGMSIAASGKSTAVVIADAGVLSNQLIVPLSEPGNDNLEFAFHLASYLAHGPDGNAARSQCVFWENSGYRLDFDNVPLSVRPPEIVPSWAMIQRAITERADKKINELQEKDFPTRNLVQAVADNEIAGTAEERRNSAGRRLTQILTAFAAVIVAIVLVRQVRTSRATREPAVKFSADAPANNNMADTLVASKNLYPAARERLRVQFEEWHSGGTGLPMVAVEGSWFYRKRMEKAVRSLWTLAYADNPVRISRRRWQELERTIREIGGAIHSGELRFLAAEAAS
jgi:hypothetical protein